MGKHPDWLFNEFQSVWSDAGDLETYDKNARVDPARERERERLLGLGVSADDTLIDFGCGTGMLVLEAAKLCRRVVAVDVSAAMLAHLRNKAARLGIDNLEVAQQGFLTYEHRGEPVDFVVTQRALHHLPDFWKVQALKRVADVLKPGGVLFVDDLFYSFGPDEADQALERWMNEVAVETGDGFSREFFEHDVREEFITYTWLFEAMVEKVGFDIEDASYGEWQAYAKYVCVKSS